MPKAPAAMTELLKNLDFLAGDPSVVDERLQSLTTQLGRAPTVIELVEELLRFRLEVEKNQSNLQMTHRE